MKVVNPKRRLWSIIHKGFCPFWVLRFKFETEHFTWDADKPNSNLPLSAVFFLFTVRNQAMVFFLQCFDNWNLSSNPRNLFFLLKSIFVFLPSFRPWVPPDSRLWNFSLGEHQKIFQHLLDRTVIEYWLTIEKQKRFFSLFSLPLPHLPFKLKGFTSVVGAFSLQNYSIILYCWQQFSWLCWC